MRKVVSLLICGIMLFMVSACFADGVDKSAFEKLDGYEYDKFEKTWSYYQAYSHKYNDAYVVVGLQVYGGSDDQMPPTLYCWIRDKTNSSVYRDVTGMMFLVGDDVYSFDNVYVGDSDSSVLLGEEAKEFLEAMTKVDSITIRLVTKTSSIDEEVTPSEYKTGLKAAAKAILASNIWDFISDQWKTIAAYYAPTKN